MRIDDEQGKKALSPLSVTTEVFYSVCLHDGSIVYVDKKSNVIILKEVEPLKVEVV